MAPAWIDESSQAVGLRLEVAASATRLSMNPVTAATRLTRTIHPLTDAIEAGDSGWQDGAPGTG